MRSIIFPNGGCYLWGALAGPANAAKRQAVMRACGVELPKAKCGYNAVVDALFARYGIAGGCHTPRLQLGSDIGAGQAQPFGQHLPALQRIGGDIGQPPPHLVRRELATLRAARPMV